MTGGGRWRSWGPWPSRAIAETKVWRGNKDNCLRRSGQCQCNKPQARVRRLPAISRTSSTLRIAQHFTTAHHAIAPARAARG